MRQKKIILKINKENDIDSIIEIFQQFEKKYEIILTQLDKNIQYQVKDTKITQTYKTTILEEKTDDIKNKLEDNGKITLLIIDNLKDKKKNNKVNEKIKKIEELKNIKTKIVNKNQVFNILCEVIEGA